MSRKTFRHISLTLALAFALTAPAASATGTSHVFSEVWNWWPRLWAKAGCIIDPNGFPCVSTPTTEARSGSREIPSHAGMSKHGCGIDPNGTPCASTSGTVDADHGISIDPDG